MHNRSGDLLLASDQKFIASSLLTCNKKKHKSYHGTCQSRTLELYKQLVRMKKVILDVTRGASNPNPYSIGTRLAIPKKPRLSIPFYSYR